MATPMITNWKKIDASKDKEVDPTLYIQLIGSLMYLVNTKPDICFAVNTLSQFMVEPKRVHWAATRHIFRYVHGTVRYGLKYSQGDDVRLDGFIDADWVGSTTDRKSAFGYCFSVGSGMISWCSRKQNSVALSSAEAKYMATSIAMSEVIWLRKLLGMRGIYNTDAVLVVARSTAVQMQHLRSSWWAVMSNMRSAKGDVTEQGNASAGYIARAYSSLRGSVDIW
eukprot:PITA_19529